MLHILEKGMLAFHIKQLLNFPSGKIKNKSWLKQKHLIIQT
jgi:hypothetical protein